VPPPLHFDFNFVVSDGDDDDRPFAFNPIAEMPPSFSVDFLSELDGPLSLPIDPFAFAEPRPSGSRSHRHRRRCGDRSPWTCAAILNRRPDVKFRKLTSFFHRLIHGLGDVLSVVR
jgi:hypothetical protein